MSGGFGWSTRTPKSQISPSPRIEIQRPSVQRPLPPPRTYQVPGRNLLIVAVDMTGSMSAWLEEILKRLSTLYMASTTFLGDDLDMMVLGFGDPARCSPDGLLIPGVSRGPLLEDHLRQILQFPQVGGGNRRENAEMALLAVDRLVQAPNVRNGFVFVITDEMAYDQIDPKVAENCGIPNASMEPFEDLVQRVSRKYHLFTVFADTRAYQDEHVKVFRPWWENLLPNRVIPLDDRRRINDVILGAIAHTVHQYDVFSSMLAGFQDGTTHGNANITTVHQSLASIRFGSPEAPAKTSKRGLMGEK